MLSSQKKYFITIIIYVALYLLSQTVLSKLYLFQWTATHHYLYVWIFSTVLLYCKKYIVSFSITFGNLFGILIGQFFGDCIKYKNILKITAEMSLEQKYLPSSMRRVFDCNYYYFYSSWHISEQAQICQG